MHKIAIYNVYMTRAMVLLGVVCALCVFLYGIFLLMAVTHTASRTAALREMNTLSAHLGDIESTYLSEQQSLTPERAAALGFVAPTDVSTVFADAGMHTLTLNTLR